MSEISYRIVDGASMPDAEWSAVEAVLAARGWMSLNRMTTPVIALAERGGMIVGFLVLQLIPHTEPLYVAPDERGTEVAGTLADMMLGFLQRNQARGWMVIAENVHAERLCEARGMVKVMHPVYVALPGHGGGD